MFKPSLPREKHDPRSTLPIVCCDNCGAMGTNQFCSSKHTECLAVLSYRSCHHRSIGVSSSGAVGVLVGIWVPYGSSICAYRAVSTFQSGLWLALCDRNIHQHNLLLLDAYLVYERRRKNSRPTGCSCTWSVFYLHSTWSSAMVKVFYSTRLADNYHHLPCRRLLQRQGIFLMLL